jgi:hypothetical protein
LGNAFKIVFGYSSQPLRAKGCLIAIGYVLGMLQQRFYWDLILLHGWTCTAPFYVTELERKIRGFDGGLIYMCFAFYCPICDCVLCFGNGGGGGGTLNWLQLYSYFVFCVYSKLMEGYMSADVARTEIWSGSCYVLII